MRIKMGTLIVLSLALFLLASCNEKKVDARTPLLASDVQSLSANFEKIAIGASEAWNSHDQKAISQVYTDDIVHYDGKPMYVGLDDLKRLIRDMMAQFPDFEGQVADTFIGKEDGVVKWEYWNVLGYSKANPIVEYDLVQTRDGRISYWRLFYFPRFLGYLGTPVDNTLVEKYATAWSSGDPKIVSALYASDGVREDTLFGNTSTDRNTVESFAADFFAWYPGVKFELLEPFSEQTPGVMKGAIYAIHVNDGSGTLCDVRVAVLLDPAKNGIKKENIYYNAESLIGCGWAR